MLCTVVTTTEYFNNKLVLLLYAILYVLEVCTQVGNIDRYCLFTLVHV